MGSICGMGQRHKIILEGMSKKGMRESGKGMGIEGDTKHLGTLCFERNLSAFQGVHALP